MKEPKAVEIVEDADKKGEYVVKGYWDGDNRAGTTFATRREARAWADEQGLIVCTRPVGHVPFDESSEID